MIFKLQWSATALKLGSALQAGKSPFFLASMPSPVSPSPRLGSSPPGLCLSFLTHFPALPHLAHAPPLFQTSPFRAFCYRFGSCPDGHLPGGLQNTFHSFPFLSPRQSLLHATIRFSSSPPLGLLLPLLEASSQLPLMDLHHS